MLYDTKWGKPSLAGMIAWLETKNPTERYDFWNCNGACLVDQYLASLGMPTSNGPEYLEACRQIFGGSGFDIPVVTDEPLTYGAALERARAISAALPRI